MVEIAFKHCLKKERWGNVLSKWIGPTIKDRPEAWTGWMVWGRNCAALTCLRGSHMVKLFLISIYPVNWVIKHVTKVSNSVVIQVQYGFHLHRVSLLRSFQLAFLSTSRLCLSLRSIWIRAKRLSKQYLITTSIPMGKLIASRKWIRDL